MSRHSAKAAGRSTKIARRTAKKSTKSVSSAEKKASKSARSPVGKINRTAHGKILALFVEKGAQVTRGQRVAIIEAMKMEHTIVAPTDGVVTEIVAAKDAQVAEGARLMTIAPPVTS